METILLIDGYSIISRAYFGNLKRLLTNSAGLPTNGLLGFMNILYKNLDALQPEYAMVAFDRKEPTFRHKLFDGYKGTRKPMPEDLLAQVPVLKELLKKSGILLMELPGYEADDLIGTAAAQANAMGMEAVILSGDRDMTQLVSEQTTLLIPVTKGGYTEIEEYTPRDVMAAYGVSPRQMIDVKALQGDSSDNIPGVPGIGPKTAQALVAKYESLDGIYAHVDEITPPGVQKKLKENEDSARLSRTLGEICRTAPFELDREAARLDNVFTPEAYRYMGELELKSLMKRFDTAAMESVKKEEKKAAAALIRVKTPEEADKAFAAVLEAKKGGLNALQTRDGRTVVTLTADGAAVHAFEKEDFEDISARINDLVKAGVLLVTADLQNTLRLLELEQSKNYFDTCIAAYLLNPSKGSYQYEDIARDYLNEVLPSAKELVADEDKWLTLEGSVMLLAQPAMEAALKANKLEKLWTDIELPLAFSLRRMEIAGIRVDAEQLKAYAE
ncbi:MAG: DNA polymerase I, partial [Lachnospiraceae bacterium]|nr:DNA polymerase I [Lachnospiraceae bacterium]